MGSSLACRSSQVSDSHPYSWGDVLSAETHTDLWRKVPCQWGCPGARCSSEEMDATPHWELWGGRHRGGARLNLQTQTRRMGTVAVNGSRRDILFDEMCQAALSMLVGVCYRLTPLSVWLFIFTSQPVIKKKSIWLLVFSKVKANLPTYLCVQKTI